jgi:hypothetical protein
MQRAHLWTLHLGMAEATSKTWLRHVTEAHAAAAMRA